MAKIHLVGGEKGGVGKSLFARALIEYYLYKLESSGLSLRDYLMIIDADIQAPLIGKTYAPQFYDLNGKSKTLEEYLISGTRFSDDEDNFRYANVIFDQAAEGRDVLVNLPANCFLQVSNWLTAGDYVLLGKEHNIEFLHWFVTDGGQESLDTLVVSLKEWQNIPHIIIKNWGISSKEWDWQPFNEREDLAILIKERKVLTLDMPRLLSDRYEDIKKQCASLKDVVDNKLLNLKLTVTQRQSVVIWRKKMFKSLEDLGIIKIIQDPSRVVASNNVPEKHKVSK